MVGGGMEVRTVCVPFGGPGSADATVQGGGDGLPSLAGLACRPEFGGGEVALRVAVQPSTAAAGPSGSGGPAQPQPQLQPDLRLPRRRRNSLVSTGGRHACERAARAWYLGAQTGCVCGGGVACCSELGRGLNTEGYQAQDCTLLTLVRRGCPCRWMLLSWTRSKRRGPVDARRAIDIVHLQHFHYYLFV